MANTTTDKQTRTSSNGHPRVEESYPLTALDVRRKRPPLLSFLLRAETLRNVPASSRCSRSTSPACSRRSSPR